MRHDETSLAETNNGAAMVEPESEITANTARGFTVIAWDGRYRYLLSADGDWETARQNKITRGRVLDMAPTVMKLMAPLNLHSIISIGYWELKTMSGPELESRLSPVTSAHPRGVHA